MHAGSNFLDSFDYHALAGFQAVADDPERANLIAHVDRLNVDGSASIHRGDLVVALHLGNCLLRNNQCAVQRFHGDAHLAVLSRAENVAWIWKQPCDLDGAGALVHLASGESELPLVWIDRSVS